MNLTEQTRAYTAIIADLISRGQPVDSQTVARAYLPLARLVTGETSPLLDDPEIDQSDTLQAAINDIKTTGGTVWIDPGRYRLDKTINFWPAYQGVRIVGSDPLNRPVFYTDKQGLQTGDVNRNGNSIRQHFSINGASGCELRNIVIEGPNDQRSLTDNRFARYISALEGEHAIGLINGATETTIENVGITNVWGDAIYLGGVGAPNQDVTIRNVISAYNGRQAMGVNNVIRATVEDCEFRFSGRSGLDIECNHDDHQCRNFTIRRTFMGPNNLPFIVGGSHGTTEEHVSDTVIEDCRGGIASGVHPAVAATAYQHNLTIRRHLDTRNRSVNGIVARNISGTVIIEDCNIASGPSSDTSQGVYIGNCPNANFKITGNKFQGVSGTPPWGADELYTVAGGQPLSITHYGNIWQAPNAKNDGPAPPF